MARIPNEEIERLKKEIPIERLVTGFGVELKRQGKDLFGRCPFHDDKTPSLSVSPETNLWHCLGACNSGGDVIAWVMQTCGVSFRHAVELLRDDEFTDALNYDVGQVQLDVKLNWADGNGHNNGNLQGATINNGGNGYPQFLTFNRSFTYTMGSIDSQRPAIPRAAPPTGRPLSNMMLMGICG